MVLVHAISSSYICVLVVLRYMLVSNFPSVVFVIKTSRNGNLFVFSTSYVNLMLLWYEFNSFCIVASLPGVTKAKVSSTYLVQLESLSVNLDINVFSSSVINTFVNRAPKGDPIITPSFCI